MCSSLLDQTARQEYIEDIDEEYEEVRKTKTKTNTKTKKTNTKKCILRTSFEHQKHCQNFR